MSLFWRQNILNSIYFGCRNAAAAFLVKRRMALQVVREADGKVCLLKKGGSVIGRASIDNGIVACWIEPQWRRKGYGTFLLKRTLLLLKVPQDEVLTAKTEGTQGAFYEKFAFQAIGNGVYRREKQKQTNALSVVHDFWGKYLFPGAIALDATAGNGHDTVILCRIVGPQGQVVAMDVQEQAVKNTRERLRREGLRAQVVHDSHENLAQYVPAQGLDAAVFNLGYLPGGTHDFFTVPECSIPAMNTALSLLKPGGILTVCAYSGKFQGTYERDAVLEWAQGLTPDFSVWTECFSNRIGLPPVAVCVRKKQARTL